jgi:sugar phosphate isomerase/epimerase
MQYGAMNFPVKPVLQELDEFSAMGFDYLELTMDPPQAHHSNIKKQMVDLVNALEQNKMGLVCHMPTFLNLGDLTEGLRIASLREMLDSLELAAELRPMKVVLHPPYVTGLGLFVYDQAKGFGMENLAAIVERGRALGLTMCLENMFAKTMTLVRPEDFDPVFDRFPDLKLTLDTGHAHCGSRGGKAPLEFISRFADRIGHVHISDNFGKEDSHLPVGAGTIDFSRFIKALKDSGYDGTMTFEIFSKDRTYLKMSRDKIAELWNG